MARDHIRSRASFSCVSWTCDFESSELTSRGESGFPMTGRILLDSGPTDSMVISGSPAGEGPAGFILPSSDGAASSASNDKSGTRVDR